MTRKRRRHYSDEERCEALAALTANGGNVDRTATQLGIPETTLRQWSKGQNNPVPAQLSDQKKESLADRLRDLAHLLVGDLSRPERIKSAGFQQVATAIGIAVDKERLLRGQPTVITDSTNRLDLSKLTDDELEDFEHLAQRASFGGDQGGKAETNGVPLP